MVNYSSPPRDSIALDFIDPLCYVQRGFDGRGCYGSDCHDACCRYGADVDRATHTLIMDHVDSLEKKVGSDRTQWFSEAWSGQADFLGGDSIRSNVGADGYCVFHVPNGKGCALYQLAFSGIDLTIVPSICRVYPLSWDGGQLKVSDHLEPSCNCVHASHCSTHSLLETQTHEVEKIFQIAEPQRK